MSLYNIQARYFTEALKAIPSMPPCHNCLGALEMLQYKFSHAPLEISFALALSKTKHTGMPCTENQNEKYE